MINVLLVEDNASDARLIELELEQAPRGSFRVARVDRLGAALERAREDHFDILLLDLSLPDAHGLDTVRRARNQLIDLPIVVLTGLDDEDVAVAAVDEGAQDYLVKGKADADALSRAIRYAMQRQRWVAQLQQLAVVDELTGLHNRRALLMLAEHHISQARRSHQPFTVVFIDLNKMKQINDTLGHHAGDRALIDTANLLRGSFRAADVLARIGGDEFCVLASGPPGGEATFLERLFGNVELHNREAGREFSLSLSVGRAHYDPAHPSTLDELLERADQAMYEEKHRTNQRRTLLVVDDDTSLRQVAQVMFDDYEVRIAGSGTEAIESALADQPDLVLLDLGLPDVPGIDVVKRLREEKRTCSTPIIVLTGSVDERSELESLQAGVDDYVTKPFSEETLRARVSRVLARTARR